MRFLDFRWTGDEKDGFENNGGGAEGTNSTFLEGAVATFLDSVPLQVTFSMHSYHCSGVQFWDDHFLLLRLRSNWQTSWAKYLRVVETNLTRRGRRRKSQRRI